MGLQGDPNTYAMYELAALPIALVWAGRARGWGRAGWILVATTHLVAVFGSQSRGALLGLAAIVLWTIFGETKSRGRVARQSLVVFGVVLSAVLVALVSLFPRLSPSQMLADRGTGRVDIWLAAWRVWQEHPVLGIGAGVFEKRSGDFLSQTPGVQLSPRSLLFNGIRVHSAYLEPLVELGPVGLVLFVALLFGAGLLMARDHRRDPHGVLGALLPMLLVYATTTVFLSTLNNKLLWMLLAFASVLPSLPRTRRAPRAEHSTLEVV